MSDVSRREFSKIVGGAGVAAAILPIASPAYARARGHVVVIGGGAGGATVTHLIKKGAPKLKVTLVETHKTYTSCFFSNLYLAGYRSLKSLTHNYSGLTKIGVKLINDTATGIDTTKRTIALKGGDSLTYDKLVLAPGIDIKYDSIEGYSPEAARTMTHAWGQGGESALLKQQLNDMEDGGVVVMAPPPGVYRCPVGPYERASMIAHYLKYHKPASKLVIYDPKPGFPQHELFLEGWQKHYPETIELHLSTEATDNRVVRVDTNASEIELANGAVIKATVLNLIPAQRAGRIAHQAGVADGDWCPIEPATFRSTLADDIYILGDAAVATKMPKTASSANSQAQVVANDIQAKLAGRKKFPPRYKDTSWALISTNNAIKSGASYKVGDTAIDVASEFNSRPDEDATIRAKTYRESLNWYHEVTSEMFAKT